MRHSSLAESTHHRNGVILIVVLVLVVMISFAGFAFMNRMATEYKATLMHGDMRQAYQTLASAESFLLHVAELQSGQPEPYNELLHDPRLFSSRMLRPPVASDLQSRVQYPSTPETHHWRFSVVNKLPSRSNRRRAEDEIRDDGQASPVRFGLQNESGKLHLGRVMLWDAESPGAGRSALTQIPGMTGEAADSILDWIDPDNEPREFGAEQEYYSQLDTPYTPRNGLPETLEELLFVKGVKRRIFYGKDAVPQQGGRTAKAWPELLTLYSAEPNQSRFGHDRIDLNSVVPGRQADVTNVSWTALSVLPGNLVKFLLLARLYGITYPPVVVGGSDSFLSAEGLQPEVSIEEINISAAELPQLSEIGSLVDLVDSAVRLPAASGGQLVWSPLRSDSSEFQETMKLLEDQVTVNADDTIIGRININTAPEPVLRALIGDPGIASRIVSQRQMIESSERECTVWLLSRRILGLQTYRRIYGDITTRGAVHSGEIVVYRKSGGPFLRRRLTIDASRRPARRIHWVNLTDHGMSVQTSSLVHGGFGHDHEE